MCFKRDSFEMKGTKIRLKKPNITNERDTTTDEFLLDPV